MKTFAGTLALTAAVLFAGMVMAQTAPQTRGTTPPAPVAPAGGAPALQTNLGQTPVNGVGGTGGGRLQTDNGGTTAAPAGQPQEGRVRVINNSETERGTNLGTSPVNGVGGTGGALCQTPCDGIGGTGGGRLQADTGAGPGTGTGTPQEASEPIPGVDIIVKKRPGGSDLSIGQSGRDGWFRGSVRVEAGEYRVSAACPPRVMCRAFRVASVRVNGVPISPNARGEFVFPVGSSTGQVRLEVNTILQDAPTTR